MQSFIGEDNFRGLLGMVNGYIWDENEQTIEEMKNIIQESYVNCEISDSQYDKLMGMIVELE